MSGAPLDIALLGRVAIDFNPAYSDAVKEDFGPLKSVHYFEKFVGGSPANIAVGLSKLGLKVGFIGKVSDDAFGEYVTDYFAGRGIDTSRIGKCEHGEKLGLTFTEMLSENESGILMYRNRAADLSLSPADVDEEYISRCRAVLVSGTALAASPSREAALKAAATAKRLGVGLIYDIDYRPYNWSSADEVTVYSAALARDADVILGSREEFNLTERLVAPGLSDEGSAEFWMRHAARLLVIKHGAAGFNCFTKSGGRYRVRPFPVTARKSFGGGDGLAAGLLYSLFAGRGVAEALEFASAEASMMVRSNNCSNDLPGAAEVRAFIDEAKSAHGDVFVERL